MGEHPERAAENARMREYIETHRIPRATVEIDITPELPDCWMGLDGIDPLEQFLEAVRAAWHAAASLPGGLGKTGLLRIRADIQPYRNERQGLYLTVLAPRGAVDLLQWADTAKRIVAGAAKDYWLANKTPSPAEQEVAHLRYPERAARYLAELRSRREAEGFSCSEVLPATDTGDTDSEGPEPPTVDNGPTRR